MQQIRNNNRKNHQQEVEEEEEEEEEETERGGLFLRAWLIIHITDLNLEIQLSLKSLLVVLLGKLPLTKCELILNNLVTFLKLLLSLIKTPPNLKAMDSACANPNPIIDGRRANCNIAALGRPRPSPPRGRGQSSVNPYQGNTMQAQASPSYGGVPSPLNQPPIPPPPPPAPPVVYSPYGYPAYSPDYGYHHHHQAVYNPQVQQPQMYQQTPYYYGYSSRGTTFPNPSQSHHHPRLLLPPPSYVYYSPPPPPPQFEASSFNYPPQAQPQIIRHRFSSTDSQTSQQTTTEAEVGGVVSDQSPTT